MQDITTPREKILKKVRAALLNKFAFQIPDVEQESPLFVYEDDAAEAFAKNFTANGGGFVYNHNKFDFIENLINLMEKRGWKGIVCPDKKLFQMLSDLGLPVEEMPEHPDGIEVGITSCEMLVGRSGAVVLSSAQDSAVLPFFAKVHLVLAYTGDVVKDMKESHTHLRNKYGESVSGEVIYIHGKARYMNASAELTKPETGAEEIIVFLVNDTEQAG